MWCYKPESLVVCEPTTLTLHANLTVPTILSRHTCVLNVKNIPSFCQNVIMI